MALSVPTLITTPISKYFTYKDALYLPSWSRPAIESDGLSEEILNNLVALFAKMDIIRDHFGMPIIVHCSYRPPAYNKQIGGAANSPHMQGKAVDWHLSGSTCDAVRKNILDNNLLETLDMRMENLPGSGWVHTDISSVIANRFFKP